MRAFRELKVWDKAHKLALAVFTATAAFPRSELYGVTAQMRRSSTSIAMNIAEGCGREGNAELRRFLLIARGSASELEYQLLLARDLHYLPASGYEQLANDVVPIKQMLTAFIRRLKPDA